MATLMHIRTARAQVLRWITALPRRFHRDDGGQMMVLASVFLLILVMALAVPVQLSLAVRQKIQAQNAADAAAITGAIWQLRGLNVVQGMNDLVYLLDSLAMAGLVAGAILGPCTGVPIAGTVAMVAGNIALGVATASHFSSQCVVMPLRDVAAHGWSLMCYVGASETARANEASPMLGATASYLGGLSGQVVRNYAVDFGLSGPGQIATSVASHDPSGRNFLSNLGAAISSFPVYAIGFEMNLHDSGNSETLDSLPQRINELFSGGGGVLPMWLHVKREHGQVGEIPLRVEDAMLNGLLQAAAPLQPMQLFADLYFKRVARRVNEQVDSVFDDLNEKFVSSGTSGAGTDGGTNGAESSAETPAEIVVSQVEEWAKKEIEMEIRSQMGISDNPVWNHAWYVSDPSITSDSNKVAMALMPTVTWASVVRDESRSFRMSAWDRLGGLGVPSPGGGFGPLGAMALASSKLSCDPVRKVRFAGLEGYVMLVPVKITEKDDARSFGICH